MTKRFVGPRVRLAVAALIAVWLTGEWLGPRLIASAYRQESLEVLNRVISGRDTHDLTFYLDAWTWLWRGAVAAGAILVALAWLAVVRRAKLSAALRDWVGAGPRVRPPVFVWYAAWFGALAGLSEAAHLSIRHLVEHQPRGFGWDIARLGPLASTLSFALLALVWVALLAVATRGRPAAIRLRPAVFVLAFFASYGVLQASDFRLARYAVLLLCAGLAATVARGAGGNGPRFRRLVRVSTPVLALALAAGVGTALLTHPAVAERRALAALPQARAGLPNVVLIILDTVRADALGLHGYTRATTPNLDAWADSGVVFDRAISTAPWTLTSHASMFTGRLPHEMNADFRVPLDDADRTLAEALAGHGYATAGFVANMGYASRLSGLARGFARYEDFPLALGRFLTTAWLPRWLVNDVLPLDVERWAGADTPSEFGKKFGEQVTDAFLGWVPGGDGRPFFAFLNYMDAHTPYIPPAPFDSMFVRPGMDLSPVARHPENSVEEMLGQRALYDGAIAYLDREIGRIFEDLRSRGVLDHTLVIVTSDHGEQFGEHGLIGHGDSLYWPVLHVPLVMVFPDRLPAGTRIAAAASLRDLPATVLDLLGFGLIEAFPGRSLARHWRTPPGGRASSDALAFSHVSVVPIARPWEPSFEGPMASLVVGDLHLIEDGEGGHELYDVARDRAQSTDLSERPELAARMAILRASLDSILGSPGPGSRAP